MGVLGFELRNQANLEIPTLEIIKSTEIEGKIQLCLPSLCSGHQIA